MANESTQVQTEVLTLEKIDSGHYQFSIPSYQRPYVWPDDDVLKLLKDINEARINHEKTNKEPNYFIGTILTSKENGIYELIDGQQRTTTLMLIAIAFKIANIDCKLAGLATYNNKPRLQFSIREQVQQLLGNLAGLAEHPFPGHETIANNPYLTRMYAALEVLKQQVETLSSDECVALANYIYANVQWVNNIVPPQMDLNRLFSTMNTAGVQLEQTDILKAKLLKRINSQKALYEGIWSACEHLENYFERNLRKVFSDSDWQNITPNQLVEFSPELFSKQDKQLEASHHEGLTIEQLHEQLKDNSAPESITDKPFETDELDSKTVYCRSIIKFPLLLIHAFRTHLALNNQEDIEHRLHSDRLLEIFEPLTKASEDEVKAFITILWQVRYQFDAWVVKWVERDDSDVQELALTHISAPTTNSPQINRSKKDISALVQLQSVRNFTGERSAQYWLTPFLTALIKQGAAREAEALAILENIDNQLSLTTQTQKEASFEQAQGIIPPQQQWDAQAQYLSKPKGTGFAHYWFQKLEYLLWKAEPNRTEDKFKKYRISSKNSVEHVHPQQEEYKNLLEDAYLHAFGNLVLLSPGENSSYGHQAVVKKRVDFVNKHQYDSLKLKAMFELLGTADNWQEDHIISHQETMLAILKAHYRNTSFS